MVYRIRFAVLAALVAGAVPAGALDPARPLAQFVRETWTARDGAPTGTINAITQTPDGYLWLGTEAEGLIRFDGVRFVRAAELDKVFERPVLRVISLLRGRDGTLWVGTEYGLGRFQGGRWSAVDRGDAKEVLGLHETPDGVVWFARLWEGLYRVAGDRVELRPLAGQPRVMAADRQGTLWVGGYRGFWRWRDGEPARSARQAGMRGPGAVDHVFCDRNGDIWVGTHDGLFWLRDGRSLAHFTRRDGLSHDDVSFVHEDRDGSLWVGTTGGGLNRRRGLRFEALPEALGLTDNYVTAIFEDREGSLWVGTKTGLNRLREGSFVTVGEPEGLSHIGVRGLAAGSDDSVWVMTNGGGLNRIQQNRVQRYTIRDGLPSNFGGPVYASRDGSLWIGQDGPTRFRGGAFRVYGQPDYVSAIVEDAHGLLIASYGRVWRFRDGRTQPYRLRDGSGLDQRALDFIWDMHVARDGALWLATTRGAFAVRRGELTRVWFKDRLSARAIHEEPDGTIWLATMAGAVRVQGAQVTTFGLAQGLLHDDIYSILGDRGGNLWMSCLRGVFRVARRELEEVASGRVTRAPIEVFGTADGMRASEATSLAQPAGCVTRDGRLWFATTAGVAVVDPGRLRRNALPPPMAIEALEADGVPIGIESSPSLRPGVGRLEIHYTALSLLAPERVRFRYRLDGFDRDWVEAGSRRWASYTNLAPGGYTFRVIACNNDGVWNETGASLRFSLRPRFYQTWLFRALVVLVVALMVWGGFRLRVGQLRARFQAALAERMRLARELHDTLEQGLAGVGLQIDAAVANLPGAGEVAVNSLRGARRMLQYSRDEARRAVMELRSQALERGDLAQAISDLASEVAAGTSTRIEAVTTGTPRRLGANTEHHLFRIGQEAVTNALKHAAATRIEIAVSFGPQTLELRVCDNGRGFRREDAAADRLHFGLRGMRERARKIEAQLDVDSDPEHGTCVRVRCALS